MDADSPPPATPSLLATVAAARITELATRAWWLVVGGLAAWAYLDAAMVSGVAASLGGAIFMAGLCMVAAVARNASAEARVPGSVRRGSILRAAGFGGVAHGGLLGAVTVLVDSGFISTVAVILGALLVALTRPTTLVALGADTPLPPRVDTPRSRQRSVPELVGALRASAATVRDETDPIRKAELAERRGLLLAELAERDPEALMLLMDDAGVRPSVHEHRDGREGPDGPVPA
jgi:energy-converting hydrogenase Eha subunit C